MGKVVAPWGLEGVGGIVEAFGVGAVSEFAPVRHDKLNRDGAFSPSPLACVLKLGVRGMSLLLPEVFTKNVAKWYEGVYHTGVVQHGCVVQVSPALLVDAKGIAVAELERSSIDCSNAH